MRNWHTDNNAFVDDTYLPSSFNFPGARSMIPFLNFTYYLNLSLSFNLSLSTLAVAHNWKVACFQGDPVRNYTRQVWMTMGKEEGSIMFERQGAQE